MRFFNFVKTNFVLIVFSAFFIISFVNMELYGETKTIKLFYKENEVKFSKLRGYDIVSLPEFDFIQDSLKVGEPMLPVKGVKVLLPSGTEVRNVRVISTREKKLEGEYYIYPVQYPIPVGEVKQRGFVEPKKEIYSSSKIYPGKLVEFLYEGYFREYHLVDIIVYPIQYKPAKRELILNTEMVIEIEYFTSDKYQLPPRLRKNEVEDNEFKEKIRKLIVNPEDISYNISQSSLDIETSLQVITQPLSVPSFPSATEGLDVKYIIITADSLVDAFQPLADWKTKKGIVSTIKTVSWISQNYSGCDLQEKIRHFIQDAYIKWGTEYILLGGDVDIVPVRLNSYGPYPAITDLYYSAIYPINNNWNSNGDHKFGDGADYLPDIWVGRAPVHNKKEVRVFIDKVFTYERNSLAPNLPPATYLTTMLSLGGIVYDIFDDSGKFAAWWSESGIYDKDYINDKLLPPWFTHWQMYEYDYHFDSAYGAYFNRDEVLNPANAIRRLNEGYGIVNHIDHSNPQEMGAGTKTGCGGITNNDASNLANGNKYFIMVSGGCSPGAFDYDCIGERLLLNKNGGAVAFIGGSRYNFVNFVFSFDSKFYKNLFRNEIYNIGHTLGATHIENGIPYEATIMNLLGDPELPIWTAPPDTLIVRHPSTITNGVNIFPVTISNLPVGKKAVICLKKGVEDYAIKTVTGTGNPVNVDFVFTPDTPGELSVTVTAHNFVPYEASVPVTQIGDGDFHLYVERYIINDDESGDSRGNGDGKVDAGETIELPITLRNSSKIGIGNVVATLAAYKKGTNTLHPYITIIDSIENFGDIGPGSSVTCLDDFKFTVSSDCPDGEVVEFRLTVAGFTDNFYLQIYAPQVQHTGHTVYGNLQPGATVGLTVELSNYGHGVAREITATLSSSSPYITSITNNPQTFEDILPNSSKKPWGSKYYFTISPSYPNTPEALTFKLTIQDAYGKTWIHNFDLKGPATPTGLNFIGYENSIDLIWKKPADSDLKGYNVYRSDSPTGVYKKINDRLIEGTSYFKDVGLQNETVYYYKVSAVDESANESNLSDYLEAWTTVKQVSGWPVKLNEKIFSSPTLFDVNNDGKMEIFIADQSGRVYAFNNTGAELFDIDNNPTTISGFAYRKGANFWSSPAIADLDNNLNNGYELVIASRGNDTLYCWHIKDIDGDRKPDPFWSVKLGAPCLSSPVIGDIDNDGYPEVVIMTHSGQVHIRRYNGDVYGPSPWMVIGGNSDQIEAYCTPSLIDLDGDSDLEIIIGGSDGYIYVCHHNGISFSTNWPFYTGRNNLGSSPAVADIDIDGHYEIIYVAGNKVNNDLSDNCVVYVKDEYGNDKSGWVSGKSISDIGGVVLTSPAVCNLDGDRELEIVVGTRSTVYAWNHDGSPLPGWPKTEAGFQGTCSSPIIANVDENPDPEIIIGSFHKNLYGWHADGTRIKGWPLVTGDMNLGTPAVGDVDGDGDNEVVVGSWDWEVYVWDTKGIGKRDWSMFHYDPQHTGWYEMIISGTIPGNTTLSGRCRVAETVTIPCGATLTIKPCATIAFAPGKSLIVEGILNANATNFSKITFTSTEAKKRGSWGSIVFSGSGANGSILNHVNVRYGTQIQILNSSNITIQNSIIKDMINGVYAYNSSGSILNNTIKNVRDHGINLNLSTFTCNQNVIIKTSNFAYYHTGFGILYGGGSSGTVWQNDIRGMNQGIGAIWGSSPASLGSYSIPRNNRVTDCLKGLVVYRESYPVFGTPPLSKYMWNSIYGNTINVSVGTSYPTYSSGLLAYGNWWGSNPPNTYLFEVGPNSWFYYNPTCTSDPWADIPLPSGEMGSDVTLITQENAKLYSLSESNGVIPTHLEPNGVNIVDGELSLQTDKLSGVSLYSTVELRLQNKYRETKDFLISYLAEHPENQAAYVELYNCYSPETVDALIEYFSSLPKEAAKEHKLLLSYLYIKQGQIDMAKKINSKIIGENPNTELAARAKINNFYIALHNENDFNGATKILNEVLNNPELLNEIDLSLAQEVIETYAMTYGKEIPLFTIKVENPNIPEEFGLSQNHQTLFGLTTIVKYQLKTPSHVTLKVYDILGREVANLVDGVKEAGYHSVIFDGSKLTNGVYFIRFVAKSQEEPKEFIQVRKVVLSR
ncbi:MAG: C25 family cysteine peptidase [candidate division WOR-3 bacterium]